MTESDIVERLLVQADGYAEAAKAESEQWGEGTDDQFGLEQHSALLSEAADEIARLREASKGQLVIVNQAKEAIARAEKAEAERAAYFGRWAACREQLRAHHAWHNTIGELGLCRQGDGWFSVDMSAEYSDSTLCGRTISALEIPPGEMPPEGWAPMPRPPGGTESAWWRDAILSRRAMRSAIKGQKAAEAALKEAKRRVESMEIALAMPDADRRQWRLCDLLARVGHFNRSDLCREFKISVQQASNDIGRFLSEFPNIAIYNKHSKRYERAPLHSAPEAGQ